MIVVLGKQPSSGTTMLMEMFDAAGQPAIRDLAGPWGANWQSGNVVADPVQSLRLRINSPGVVKLFRPQILELLSYGYKPKAVVVPVRPYKASAASWQRRSGQPLESEKEIDLRYGQSLLALGLHHVPVFEVLYQSLIKYPERECRWLVAALAHFGVLLDLKAMAAIPDQDLCHHKF